MSEYIIRETGYPGAIKKEIVQELVRCKDCRWWDKREESNYGYCHAAKHGYYSKNWEISIYRTCREDFFCGEGEREEDDDTDTD